MKKQLVLCGGISLIGSMLIAGCGNNQTEDTSSGESLNKITMMVPFIETDPPEADNMVHQKLEEYTGKEITINWVPNPSYVDKMNITLASDDIPEIIVIQGKDPGFVKSAENGTFWDLTDYIQDYPNLSQANEEILQASSLNGKVYGIYRARDLMRSTAIIRKDWLEKLGLEEPQNIEDLYNVAKAFKEQDPEGNGEGKTTGIIIPNFAQAFDILTIWYGAGNNWVDENGTLKPSFQTDEYLEAIKFAQKMVDEGLINKDFATLSSDNWNDPFVNGTGGIILDMYSRASQIANVFKQQDPENGADKVLITGNLAGPDGNVYAQPTAGYSGFLAIPKASVKTEEELREVLDFIDKTNDKDMQILLNNGIEGVNFEVEDGFSVAIEGTEEATEVANAIKSYAQMGTNVTEESVLYTAKPATDKDLEFWNLRKSLEERDLAYAVYDPAAAYVTDTYATKGAQLDQIITDARVKFIAGQIDEAGWKDAITLWENSGGKDLIEETNTLYQADN
ncbi:extracellular solute-binding protein [Enterococcus sp. RIT-PI-f]|uniref:extracellular solute-binding protein n=1 Tax=Enterococcus sp. RIT-PI-f TaxID=1690244 RepID=UPI0006B8D22D|nr:extracellular solute-binding protein [Enterococcus sp. RIT-PI-f]KPG73766.1 ABC transporter substrate-binding protein [Enterococcus sp. RIT-PI-f]